MHKSVKKLIRDIEANGFSVDTSGKHPKVRAKDGTGMLYVLPVSPGRGRWEHNLRSELRKRGVLQ